MYKVVLISSCIVTSSVLYPSSAFAYLDPGTGTIIMQAILAAITSTILFLSVFWLKVKRFLKNFFQKNKTSSRNVD